MNQGSYRVPNTGNFVIILSEVVVKFNYLFAIQNSVKHLMLRWLKSLQQVGINKKYHEQNRQNIHSRPPRPCW